MFMIDVGSEGYVRCCESVDCGAAPLLRPLQLKTSCPLAFLLSRSTLSKIPRLVPHC